MKNITSSILYILLIIFLFASVNLFAQKSDSTINKRDKPIYQLSLGFVTSPLIHTNSSIANDIYLIEQPKTYITIPTGLFFSLRCGKEEGPGLSVGLMFDIKKYYVSYYSPALTPYSNSTTIEFNYHYLYIPILVNYYFRNYYISFGGMFRRPVFTSGINANDAIYNINNPAGGFQIGFGEIFNINSHLNLQVEPYLILTSSYDAYFGKVVSVDETISSGPLIGIYLKLTKKIIIF